MGETIDENARKRQSPGNSGSIGRCGGIYEVLPRGKTARWRRLLTTDYSKVAFATQPLLHSAGDCRFNRNLGLSIAARERLFFSATDICLPTPAPQAKLLQPRCNAREATKMIGVWLTVSKQQ